MASSSSSSDVRPTNWSSLCVLVDGLNADTPGATDLLKAYFEDEVRSGGGTFQEQVYFVGSQTAIICFAESEVKSRVLARDDHQIQISEEIAVKLVVTKCPLQLEEKYVSVPTALSDASVDSDAKRNLFAESPDVPKDTQDGPQVTISDPQQSPPSPAKSPRSDALPPVYQSKFCDMQREELNKWSAPDVVQGTESLNAGADAARRLQSDERERTVIVEGFDEGTTADILDLLLEDSLGEDGVVKMSLEPDESYAKVVLASSEMVEQIIAAPPQLEDTALRVSRPETTTPTPILKTVEVIGLESRITSQYLKLFFKSKKKSGGGPIEDVYVDPSLGVAKVTFCNPKDAEEVAQKRTHTLMACTFETRLIGACSQNKTFDAEPSNHNDANTLTESQNDPVAEQDLSKGSLVSEDTDMCVKVEDQTVSDATKPKTLKSETANADKLMIEVRCVPPGTGQQMLELFFENGRKSGGGPIDQLHYSPSGDHALISFKEEEVAERVLAKKTLRFADTTLTVCKHPNPGDVDTEDPAAHDISVEEDKTVLQVSADQMNLSTDESSSPPRTSFPEINKLTDDPLSTSQKPSDGDGNHQSEYCEGKEDVITEQPVSIVSETPQRDGEDQQEENPRKTQLEQDTALTTSQSDVDESACRLSEQNAVPSDPEDIPVLEIHGFPAGSNPQMIQLFFESRRQCGGGVISHLDYNKENGHILITYKNKEDAERVLSKQPFTLGNAELQVTVFQQVKPEADLPQMPGSKAIVEVSGAAGKEAFVKTFFETHEMSGGGPLLEMRSDSRSGITTLFFKSPEDASEVLKRGSYMVGKQEWTVQSPSHMDATTKGPQEEANQNIISDQYTNTPLEEQQQSPTDHRIVRVYGIRNSDESFVKTVFEKKALSGGGPIEEMIHDNENATICFKNPEDAQEVLKRGKVTMGEQDWIVKPAALVVTASKEDPVRAPSPTFAPVEEQSHSPVYPCIVRVYGIRDSNESFVKSVFENKALSGGGPIEEIIHDNENTNICFKNLEDAQEVLKRGKVTMGQQDWIVKSTAPFATAPREDLVSASPPSNVPVEEEPQSLIDHRIVRVYGIRNSDESFVKTVFENKALSGGGPIEEMISDDQNTNICFKNPEDAQEVLKRGKVTMGDQEWIVRSAVPVTTTPKEDKANQHTLEVRGIKPDTSPEHVALFLESSKANGGEIKNIQYVQGSGIALVTFVDPEVASRVLNEKNLRLDGSPIQINRSVTSPTGSNLGPNFGEESLILDTIEVKGLDSNMTKDYIGLFFESRKSGGGPIRKIHLQNEAAVITFKNPKDAARVVDTNPRIRDDRSLTINLLDTSEATAQTCAIEVVDIDSSISEERLSLFFENRRSGGGEIEHLEFDKSRRMAVITFENPEVVNRVLAKNEKEKLSLDGHEFKVSRVKPAPPPPVPRRRVDPYLFLVRHISPKCSPGELEDFLCKYGNCEVDSIEYGLQPGIALVRFRNLPDYDALREICLMKPLRGAMISIQKVEKSKAIQVHKVNQIKSETLQLYFENENRSGGGGDTQIVMRDANQDCMIIEFADPSVINRVLQKRTHKVEEQKLLVLVYHAGLGIIPPGYDTSTPAACIPTHVDVPVTPAILQFWINSKKTQQAIESELRPLYCSVQWPPQTSDPLCIVCELKQDLPNIQPLARSWEDDVRDAMYQIWNRFEHVCIQPLQHAWKPLTTKAGRLMISEDKDVLNILVDDSKCEILLAGVSDKVRRKAGELNAALQEIIDTMNREANSITETITSLSGPQLKLLAAHGLPNMMKQKFPHLKFVIKKGKISITGLPDDIMSVKLQTFEFVQNPFVKFIPLPTGLKRLMKSKNVERYLFKKLDEAGVKVVWEMVEDGIKLFSINKSEQESASQIMKASLRETPIPVSANGRNMLQGKEWKEFEKGINNNPAELAYVDVFSKNEATSVIVDATDSVFEEVMNAVKGFLEENTIFEKFLPVPVGMARFVDRQMKNELEGICKSVDRKVTMEVIGDDGQHGICLKGNSTAMGAAKEQLDELIAKIKERQYAVTKAGMEKVFSGTRGMQFCQTLEASMRTTVEKRRDVGSAEQIDRADGGRRPQVKTRVRFEGATLIVAEADLPNYPADAIVNAANQDLSHAGGLAGAVVEAGGLGIQAECTQHVQLNGRLLPGQVYVSDPGKLQCRKIIHAVGPKWVDGKSGEPDNLFEAVFESLKMAHRHQLRSIAFPPISTGIYGYPLEAASRVILEAIMDFYQEGHSTPSEVHLVSNEARSVHVFLRTTQQTLGKGGAESLAQTREPTPRAQKPTWVDPSPARPTRSRGAATPKSSSASFKPNGKDSVVAIAGGVKVTVVTGSIDQQQVDVIVNTTSKDFNLNSGAVSAAIARTGGPSLQAEITAVAPNGAPPGQIVVTSGGNLSCSSVYHGALEEWDGPNGRAPQVLRSFLRACFAQANADSRTSLALPPLGMGNLRSPPEEVSKLMLEEIALFSKNNANTTLKNIYIVVYHQDLGKLTVFEKALRQSTSDQEVGNRHNTYRESNNTSKSGSQAATGNLDSFTFLEKELASAQTIKIGPVQLLIHQGDITKVATEAIVNSTNSRLDLSGGAVQQAILRAAGRVLVQECRNIGRTQNGIAVTSAGALPMKNIIHVALDEEGGNSAGAWQRLVKRALTEANKRGLKSIAFPALGTGIHSGAADGIADAMFEGLALFVEKVKPKSLLKVNFTIYQPKMLQIFIDTLRAKVEQKGKPTLWQRFVKSLPPMFSMDRTTTPETSIVPTLVEDDSKLVLFIYALSQAVIDKVIEQIEQFCDSETKDITIDDPDQQAVIQKLSEQQVHFIQTLSRPHGVKITVERKKKTNRIRIQGENDGAMQAWQAVLKILQDVQKVEQEKEAALLIANQLQWEYRDEDESFSPYPPELNMKIEKAFSEKNKSFQWTEEKEIFKINFDKMTEEIVGQAGSWTDVRRKATGEAQVPQNWEKMAPGDRFKLVRLSSADMEYQQVSRVFSQSIQNQSTQIVQIQRVQNPSLYMRYQTHHSHMEKENPNDQIEHMLWHGTAADALPNINAGGLNRNYCGKNATMLGKGVYFARDASYSARDTYSPADANGNKHMYYCRVLTGKYTRGQSGLPEPPEKDPQKPGDRYDSVVDSTSNPGIFVIFCDTQAYPEHLITFK